MNWDHAMYALGVASLTAIFGVALRIFRDDIVRHWPRIIRTLRGNDEPGFVPLSPTDNRDQWLERNDIAAVD